MTPTLVNAPIDSSMTLSPANEDVVDSSSDVAATPRSDVLFVLASLAVGGSERKIARMANRLKDDGLSVSIASLNGPYTLESGLRRDLKVHKLERRG